MIIRFVLLIAAAVSFSACASHKKPSANFYEGDAPTIHYNSTREVPGGRVHNHTFH